MSENCGAYVPGKNLQSWVDALPNILLPGSPISGHGSPEGVIPAPVGKIYTDLDTLNLYQKERGTSAIGWVLRGAIASGTSGGTTGTGYPVLYGPTAERDATTPTVAFAVWFLTDSTPPYQLSIWANNQWN